MGAYSRLGAYSRWALIRFWALIRINTVLHLLLHDYKYYKCVPGCVFLLFTNHINVVLLVTKF